MPASRRTLWWQWFHLSSSLIRAYIFRSVHHIIQFFLQLYFIKFQFHHKFHRYTKCVIVFCKLDWQLEFLWTWEVVKHFFLQGSLRVVQVHLYLQLQANLTAGYSPEQVHKCLNFVFQLCSPILDKKLRCSSILRSANLLKSIVKCINVFCVSYLLECFSYFLLSLKLYFNNVLLQSVFCFCYKDDVGTV